MGDLGPVQIPKGKIIHRRWKVLKKLGEGGCGAVYKVEDINSDPKSPELAALKAESNQVSGGSVLKLEVQILTRLEKHAHVARLLHAGKKTSYCYMVMTLLGDNLSNLRRKMSRTASISTQTRIAISLMSGLKQIHEIGFVHRDLKPANVALGKSDTSEHRFLHILDFGLAREFVIIGQDGAPKMRRPRSKALFRGTTRYCSINTHDRLEQGRVDDLWCLLYILAELRGLLPWGNTRSKAEVGEIKKAVDLSVLLENSPYELVEFGIHLSSLTYYSRPDYGLLFNLLNSIMKKGDFKYSDPWDWEKGVAPKSKEQPSCSAEKDKTQSKEQASSDQPSVHINVPPPVTGVASVSMEPITNDNDNPFPEDLFTRNMLGF